jgi:pimeloyl-ACP methyl ester carboxylesterase
MPRTANPDGDQPPACSEKRFTIAAAGRQLETLHLTGRSAASPTIVFLHEGLGSISLWRDFPQRVVAATGCSALIYSRYGYGESDALEERRKPDYMHREALDVLPEMLAQCEIETPILFGHSDGASIALIYAGAGHDVAGLIVAAPHLFVEDISLQGAAQAALAYRTTDLPQKLARHHRDADKTFWGWHDIWTHADFRDWNIESYIASICCPILAIQGEQDDYGSAAQIQAITNQRPQHTSAHLLADCGHTPHRDQAIHTLELVSSFVKAL